MEAIDSADALTLNRATAYFDITGSAPSVGTKHGARLVIRWLPGRCWSGVMP